jgi:hypothetical protein
MGLAMSAERARAIEMYRVRQPAEELERKLDKAKGRHSNDRWCQEAMDVAAARAIEILRKLRFKGYEP